MPGQVQLTTPGPLTSAAPVDDTAHFRRARRAVSLNLTPQGRQRGVLLLYIRRANRREGRAQSSGWSGWWFAQHTQSRLEIREAIPASFDQIPKHPASKAQSNLYSSDWFLWNL